MAARITRDGFWRRRNGFQTLHIYKDVKGTGLVEVTVTYIDWFAGRLTNGRGEERLAVQLFEVSGAADDLLALSHVKVDDLYYGVDGVDQPIGGKKDWLIWCATDGNRTAL